MVPGGHRAVAGFTFNDINNSVEKIGSPVLSIECPGHHGMDSCEVCLAVRTTIDAVAREVTAVAHAHGCMKELRLARR